MSRAFTKEPDGSEPINDLPELPVSMERNLVTPSGMALIEDRIAHLQAALAEARSTDDAMAAAIAARDLRYWASRRQTAELVTPTRDTGTMRFGLCVTLEDEDGKAKTFRIVGQDEADAANGLLSYTAPLARNLIGKSIGDTVMLAGREMTVAAIAAP